jgi:hypothetical protein
MAIVFVMSRFSGLEQCQGQRTWSDEVLNIGAERFERRLAETASGLRVQIAESEARLRQELSGMEVRSVREIAASRVDLSSGRSYSGLARSWPSPR